MRRVIIKTQSELDNYTESSEFTVIEIRTSEQIIVRKALGNSTVEAFGNSTVKALGNSTVEAFGNSTVKAWGNSTVEAFGNSTVKAFGNSTVKAWGNSTVKAWGNSTVEAFGNSTVEAAFGESVVIFIEKTDVVARVGRNASILYKNRAKYNKQDFIDIFELGKVDGKIKLFKSVNPTTKKDFWTGNIKYSGIVECPDWDSDPNRECGGGLHLSPTPEIALSFNEGKVLACLVAMDDFVIYPYDIRKVRCKKVEIINE